MSLGLEPLQGEVRPRGGFRSRDRLLSPVLVLRPLQWVKNAFVFSPLVFSQSLGDGAKTAASLRVFGLFCLASGASYIFNDLMDREEDLRHPRRRNRPIASGALPRPAAIGELFLLAAVLTALLGRESIPVILVILAYLLLNLAYSVFLKKIEVLDVMAIAAGFVLRVFTGGAAAGVKVTPWLIASTFTLCLFIGFGKRKAEMVDARAGTGDASPPRGTYKGDLLDPLLSISFALSFICYLLYTVTSETAERAGKGWLPATAPFVFYCLFRFWKAAVEGRIFDVTDVVFKDIPCLVSFIGWIGSVLLVLYGI